MRSTNYNSPIDQWACGGMLAELFTLRPIFPGSSEADEIYKICSILGSPTMRSWPEGIRLAAQMSFKFPQFVPTPLSQIVPNASPEALSLMQDLMKFDPQQRPTAAQTLQYPFFQLNASMPPLTNYESPAPTFMRRPVVKSDAERRQEERDAERAAEEALEEGQVFIPPMISALREEDTPSLMNTTYLRKRIDGEPRAGKPSSVQINEFNNPTISEYTARTNELLGRAGSTEGLEALLNDIPTKDVYGRTIIADKYENRNLNTDPDFASSSFKGLAGSDSKSSLHSGGSTMRHGIDIFSNNELDDLESLLNGEDSNETALPPEMTKPYQHTTNTSDHKLSQSPHTIQSATIQSAPNSSTSSPPSAASLPTVVASTSSFVSAAGTLMFGPATQTFGPGVKQSYGSPGDDVAVAMSDDTAAGHSHGSGEKRYQQQTGAKRAGRVRLPGALGNSNSNSNLGIFGDESSAAGIAGSNLQSPIYSSTAPSFSKTLGGPHYLAAESLSSSLTAARDDLFNPNYLSSSSAREYVSDARASVSDAKYLSAPSNPSHHSSHAHATYSDSMTRLPNRSSPNELDSDFESLNAAENRQSKQPRFLTGIFL